MTLLSDLFEPPRAHAVRWAAAAVLVLAAHVGCTALALMHWQEDAADDAAASPVIVEMMPTPSVARVDSPDVAHGPLAEEATLTPQAAKETKEEVEKETPPVDSSPLAPEPEVVLPVARPIPEKKPEEELPKEEVPKQQSADQTTAAPLTTAPPRVDAPQPTPAVAPSPGASASVARVRASWEKALVKHLDRFKRYPEIARARGNQGETTVQFTVDRTGHVISARVVHSSGSSTLDEEALAVLKRADPLPPAPDQVGGLTFDLSLPIQFRIR
jgi:periplasmic protein TonB